MYNVVPHNVSLHHDSSCPELCSLKPTHELLSPHSSGSAEVPFDDTLPEHCLYPSTTTSPASSSGATSSTLLHPEISPITSPSLSALATLPPPNASGTLRTLQTHESNSRSRRSPDRVPRPPNAFMLFRSDFLKRGFIPPEEEKRQQNLSRIAGEVWRMLPDDQKDDWRQKAAKELKNHSEKYPNYKFTPAPRGSAKSRAKEMVDASEIPEDAKERRIREIREKYTLMTGPAPPPTRRRNKRAARGREHDKSPHPFMPAYPPIAFAAPKPRLSESRVISWLPASVAQGSYPCAPSIYPVPRRPSTSLGFSASYGQNSLAQPPLRRSSSVGLTEGSIPQSNENPTMDQHHYLGNYSMHPYNNEYYGMAHTSNYPFGHYQPHHNVELSPSTDGGVHFPYSDGRPQLSWETLFEPNVNPFANQSPQSQYPSLHDHDCPVDPLYTPEKTA